MRVFVAFIMSLLTPLISIFSCGGYKGEKSFTPYPETVKEERKVFDYKQNKNIIFVSPEGKDSAAGTQAEPLKTLEAACEKAKTIKSGGISIVLRDGEYKLDKTLVLDGTFPENVSFGSYPGEKAVITSRTAIDGFSEETANGVRVFAAKVNPELKFKTLLKGNKVLPRTRYPESGYFNLPDQQHAEAMYTPENTPWSYTLGDHSFEASDKQQIKKFYNLSDVTLRLMHYWCAEVSFLKTFDEKNSRYSITEPLSMTATKGDRYYFENVFEALNTPGEWYLDSVQNKLYYVPEADEKPENTVLYAAPIEKLADISGCKNIKFENITFEGSDWSYPDITKCDGFFAQTGVKHPQAEYDSTGAVEVTKSTGIGFINCGFSNLGNTALKFNKYCKDFEVRGCDFTETGACAVYIHGDNTQVEADITENGVVTDNLIKGYGRNFAAAVGVLITNARNIDLSNNEICDGYYSGISVGWTWGYSYNVTNNIQIKNNLIYDIGHGWLSDMGGIYTLGMQPDTVISGNVISNVAADEGEGGYGGWGIYLDEGSSGILVEKNLVYACGSQSFHQHYGKENTIRNNIFALSKNGGVQSSRSEEHTAFIFENNIVVSDNAPMYTKLDGGTVKDNNNLFWDYTLGKKVISINGDNFSVIKNRFTVKFAEKEGRYNNGVFEDPLFRDPFNYDFALAEESPALSKIGFEKWDYSLAGTLTKH